MMDLTTGEYELLTMEKVKAFQEASPPPEKVLVWGTEDQMAQMSTRIQQGNRAAQNRKIRRKAQANARRRNRG